LTSYHELHFWMNVICPINIQIDMKLSPKTEFSKSIGMDPFPLKK